jgi:hypothetical protein
MVTEKEWKTTKSLSRKKPTNYMHCCIQGPNYSTKSQQAASVAAVSVLLSVNRNPHDDCFAWNAFMRETSFSTPAFGIAL